MFKASILSAVLTAGTVISASALAQTRMVPPPGTIEDPNIPIKRVADGPPRSLIRMDVPDKHKSLAATASSGSSR